VFLAYAHYLRSLEVATLTAHCLTDTAHRTLLFVWRGTPSIGAMMEALRRSPQLTITVKSEQPDELRIRFAAMEDTKTGREITRLKIVRTGTHQRRTGHVHELNVHFHDQAHAYVPTSFLPCNRDPAPQDQTLA
jgi:hypothetical protein